MNLRNIAIIAHVDHGKTTLVDEIIKQAIEWTIDDCMNHLNNELNDYVETEEFSKKMERVI